MSSSPIHSARKNAPGSALKRTYSEAESGSGSSDDSGEDSDDSVKVLSSVPPRTGGRTGGRSGAGSSAGSGKRPRQSDNGSVDGLAAPRFDHGDGFPSELIIVNGCV